MTGNTIAGPQCFVEIYPWEGGSYAFSGPQILRCNVDKNIRADRGTFSIALPPGGPFGVNGPEWTRFLTPSSLVLIGMTRGIYREVVMVGVLRRCAQETVFTSNVGARRAIVITGDDFAFFFNTFNWASLSFLGGSAAAIGQATSGDETQGLPQVLSDGLLSGQPSEVASNWFNEIMAGSDGILAQTTMQYAGQQIYFPDAMSTLFEAYPNFTIPFGDYYISMEGSWAKKFQAILSFPWYEFFVITAPTGTYPGATEGIGFTMNGIGPSSIVAPTLVGRLNPIPTLKATANGNQSITFNGGVDTTRWQGLHQFGADSGFIESEISFDLSEVRNFYLLDPVWMKLMFGQTNSLIIPTIFSFAGAYDPDSIHRYGFHPERTPIRWMSDLQGNNAQNNASDASSISDLWADLIGRLASYHHPLPLMAKGAVKYPLRPDIIPGNTFIYMPFKSGDSPYSGPEEWEFYIEGISHEFIFGGRSTTTLTLCRGLPAEVYGNTELLGAVIQGTAERVNGAYRVGNNKGLQTFSIAQANDVMSQIAKVWSLAQQN